MPIADEDPETQSLKWFTQGHTVHRWYSLALAFSGSPSCVASGTQQVNLLCAPVGHVGQAKILLRSFSAIWRNCKLQVNV